MKDKFRKIRLRLAEDIINDQVGGAGWMYLDIALQVDKYSPKTLLVKTRKSNLGDIGPHPRWSIKYLSSLVTMKDKFRKIRLRLAEDIINDQVGGAGWMYLDIALQVDKYSPTTLLVKTRKCDPQGKIVLEPKAKQRTSNYLVPKDPSWAKILDGVPVQSYPKNVSWKQTYSYERSVNGNFSLKAVDPVGFSAEGCKTKKRCVETTCTNLVHKSVDIEDLRKALSGVKARTKGDQGGAEGIWNETSFLVVTDVLIAGEISIVETRDCRKDGKLSGNAGYQGMGVEAGGGATKETAASLERSNTETILAIKLAQVQYDEEGSIKRVLACGSYDGNYTLGFGNMEREGHYTVTTQTRPIGVTKDTIHVVLVGQSITEVKLLQDVCETGLQHQTIKSLPTLSEILPLKGILVFKSTEKKASFSTLMRRFSTKEAEELKLVKVLVTDLEQDRTYVCPCSEETPVTEDRRLWFDCKQWREEDAGQEFQVTVNGKPYSVSEEDPIVRIFGDNDIGRISWTNARDKGEDAARIEKTFKEYGIKAGAVIELWPKVKGGDERGGRLSTCKLKLTFEACQVTLHVDEDKRIDTLPEKLLALLVMYHGGEKVTDAYQRLDDLDLLWDPVLMQVPDHLMEKMRENRKKTDEVTTPGDRNKFVLKIEEKLPVSGIKIRVSVPASNLKMTVHKNDIVFDIMQRLCRVYGRMNVVHDGRVITDLTQTYRQLGIQATAHVQLQAWDSKNVPVVARPLEEVEEMDEAVESLVQELQEVEQGSFDADRESEEKIDWYAVRRILWRHLELPDGDPDIPPGALLMLIREVGEDTVAGEVLKTILEAALEREEAASGAEGAR
ncbi:uncharacterized protein LOC144865576 [Branchiostoma floridae x Branchiostoma japonicum]